MPAFRYRAVDTAGRERAGIIDIDTARSARAKLRGESLTPIEVEPIEAAAGASAHKPSTRAPLSSAALAFATRQFASFLAAGLTIGEALAALTEQTDDKGVRAAFAQLASEIGTGQTLAQACANQPRVFDERFRALVTAGEASGKLPLVLDRLADHLERREATRAHLSGALLYPVIVSVIALAVVTGLMTFVVPQMVAVFESTRQSLPWLTRVVMRVAHALRDYGVGILIVALLCVWLARRAWRTRAVRDAAQQIVLRLPFVGRIVRESDTARMTASLGILLESGVPLPAALASATHTLSSQPLRDALAEVAERVRRGESLAAAFKQTGAFPPLVHHLTAAGEASGRLGEMLTRAAASLEAALSARLRVLNTVLEPALILFVGGMVLVIVLAVMLPIFELNQLAR